MEYIIDGYAWIEYFIGSAKGKMLKTLFSNSGNSFFIVVCCLAEIHGWALKNGESFDKLLKVVRSNSSLLELSEGDWIKAALERFKERMTHKDFGLIDATILVKQKERNCRVVSGDRHFKGKKGVIFLE